MRRLRTTLPPRSVPLMGLTAAFVFAAQMLNFPIAAGTSGHLLGAVLAAVLLGPSAAVLVMTSVLLVQSLLFADGGILALGANILNLALIAPVTGYGIYRAVRTMLSGDRGMLAAAAFAGWGATVIAAIACAAELAWSGTAPWAAAFPAMTSVHMIIGLAEGLITALVLAALAKARPDLLPKPDAGPAGTLPVSLVLTATVSFALLVTPFSFDLPDGLEKVAATVGFDQRAVANAGPFADYRIPGIGSAVLATGLAAAAGTLIVFLLSLLLARALVPASPHKQPQS